jgi:hypothetical protein
MEYKGVHNTHLHYATITRRGKVLATSRNRIGSRSRGCGWGDQSLHAERAVVKSLGDTSQLHGCILEVVRVNKHGEFLNSKPCESCTKFLEKCIKQHGLLKVLYSVSPQNNELPSIPKTYATKTATPARMAAPI